MEQVLHVYTRAHDPLYPVICMDETTKQCVKETRPPQPPAPECPARYDAEYERNGVAHLLLYYAPLENWRRVDVKSDHVATTWAEGVRRLVEKLQFVYTPKHGSWLNMAECEFSVLARQRLNRRLPDTDTVNEHATPAQWRFTTEDARIKLHSLYPKLSH